MSEPIKYTLKTPVALGERGTPITELVFRATVVAGDLRGLRLSALADLGTDDLLKVAARLCAQPEPVLTRLSLEDFVAVVEIVGGFLFPGRKTGLTQSP
jgi:hypothetical protein